MDARLRGCMHVRTSGCMRVRVRGCVRARVRWLRATQPCTCARWTHACGRLRGCTHAARTCVCVAACTARASAREAARVRVCAR
eukprot:12766232-Alexandrium_andersonii.AAC.1